ncbi:MAG: biotin transporter BioY [Bacteroidota bacterium]|nr:biotin transporter BioY [Rhodothermia bacterium]MDW8285634.1 biotin transporter BioY [Bacteroidota bacterium]
MQTSFRARVDVLRQAELSLGAQALGVVGFALLTALGAKVRLYLWEVPFTLQTLGMLGAGLFLGPRNGLLSQTLYLGLGLFLPVFAGSGYGPGYLLGATGGYLLAFPLAAYVVGRLTQTQRSWSACLVALLVGGAIVFGIGLPWLHWAAGHASWSETLHKGLLPFLPWEATKWLLLSSLYRALRSWR